MLEDLNQAGARLSLNIDCSGKVTEEEKDLPGIIFLGGEAAAKLKSVGGNLGRHAHMVQLASLKRSDIESATEKMKEIYQNVDNKSEVTLVCMAFDERAFLAVHEDGSVTVLSSTNGNESHVEGDLAVIGDDQIRLICDKVAPILREAPELFKVIVGPAPKFICQPCRQADDHMPNRSKPDFVDNMMRGIANIKNIGRRQIHNNGILKSSVINVAPMLKDYMTAEAHERDGETDKQEPSHKGYEALLAEVEDTVAGMRTTAALAAGNLMLNSPRMGTSGTPASSGRPEVEIIAEGVVRPPPPAIRGRGATVRQTRGTPSAAPARRGSRSSAPSPSPSPPASRRRRSSSRSQEQRTGPYDRPAARPIPQRRPSDTGSSGSSGGGHQHRADQQYWEASNRHSEAGQHPMGPPDPYYYRDEPRRDRRRHASDGAVYHPAPAPRQPPMYFVHEPYQGPASYPPGPPMQPPQQQQQQQQQQDPSDSANPDQRREYDRREGGIWILDQDSRYSDYSYDYPRYGGESAPYKEPRR